ncbi:MAG: hypothetical protein ACI3XR_05920 [Eubacteriales bacterium]
MKQQKWVAVYYDDNPNGSFDFGKILAVDENTVLLYSLSPNGEYDGYELHQTSSVVRVETDSQYVDKMMKLQSDHLPKPFVIPDSCDDPVSEVLTGISCDTIAVRRIQKLSQINSGNI